MLSSFRDFPMTGKPTITYIRSWFGLVRQFAPFLATVPLMKPFQELLKSNSFHNEAINWDSNLQQSFLKSKKKICDIIIQGFTFYDTKRNTPIITDWSKKGIGFAVMQQYCNCSSSGSPRK